MKLVTRTRIALLLFLGAVVTSALPVIAQTSPAQPETVLHPADVAKILPGSLFFRGQSATTQARNSGGVRFADGFLVLISMVDNSGYSTGVQEKYQAYFITEVPLDISGHHLVPGAYGAGMIKGAHGPQFVLLDIGAHELFVVDSNSDAKFRRPTPLQLLEGEAPGKYRLYFGRNYVEFQRAQ